MNILIINYGTCNIRSIYNSIKKIKKVNVKVNEFNYNYDKIIFPGQGHIKESIKFINSINNIENIIYNKHILGICIGYHVFFKKSYEDNKIKSLNFIKEDIKKIKKVCCNKTISPNIGWKTVKIIKKHDIFKNIPNKFNQYFMHSFSSIYKNQSFSFSISKYNSIFFNSIIIKKNKFLFQFHPEKSGKYGLKIIKNFLNL